MLNDTQKELLKRIRQWSGDEPLNDDDDDAKLDEAISKKLKFVLNPGASVRLIWDGEEGTEIIEDGYLTTFPYILDANDSYMTGIVHIPYPVWGVDKGPAEPEWIHLNDLLLRDELLRIEPITP